MGRQAFVEIQRRGGGTTRSGRGAQQAARSRRREPGEVGREHGLGQGVPFVGEGEPAKRQQVGKGGGLGLQSEPGLGDDPRNPRVVEGAKQPGGFGTSPAHDHRQIAPCHRVLHVHAPKLAGDRGVLLRAVRPRPGLDRGTGGAGETIRRLQFDHGSTREVGGELAERPIGRSLEREYVRPNVPRYGEARRAKLGQQARHGSGGLLVVVDHDVVVERLGVRGRVPGLDHQPREIDFALVVEDVEVATIERRQLGPPSESRARGCFGDVLGQEPRLLGPPEELADLVGETLELEHAAEGLPLGGILAGQQLTDPVVLLGRGQQARCLTVAERLEAPAHDVEGQPVCREHAKTGKRTVEPVEQEGPNRAPVPARANHERYPLGVGI